MKLLGTEFKQWQLLFVCLPQPPTNKWSLRLCVSEQCDTEYISLSYFSVSTVTSLLLYLYNFYIQQDEALYSEM